MHRWFIVYKWLFFLFGVSTIFIFLFLFLYKTNPLYLIQKNRIEKDVLIESMPFVSNTPIIQLENKEFDYLTLMISDTDIVIPIVQGFDNSYYLNHSLTGEENKIGTPFLDYRNHLDDQKLLIYGHNSRTLKTEFHILEKYLNYSFFKEHSILILNGKDFIYRYLIFSVFIVSDDFQHMRLGMNPVEYKDHLRWLQNHSIYNTFVDVYDNDDILILQTCYYHPENSYLLIVSKKVK